MYVIYIDIFPHVLEGYYFTGHIHDYSGKSDKILFLTKCRRNTRREAHLPCKSGPSTTMAALQVHQGTDRAKAVANGPTQGAAAPPPSLLDLSLLWRLHGGMQ
jgi:hypothetical protein